MMPVEEAVNVHLRGSQPPNEALDRAAKGMLDELHRLSGAFTRLRAARAAQAVGSGR
jgi:hypothetical protein